MLAEVLRGVANANLMKNGDLPIKIIFLNFLRFDDHPIELHIVGSLPYPRQNMRDIKAFLLEF